jgi:hypothetical protein
VSNQLTEEELARLMPSEMLQHRTPIPTHIDQNQRRLAILAANNPAPRWLGPRSSNSGSTLNLEKL